MEHGSDILANYESVLPRNSLSLPNSIFGYPSDFPLLPQKTQVAMLQDKRWNDWASSAWSNMVAVNSEPHLCVLMMGVSCSRSGFVCSVCEGKQEAGPRRTIPHGVTASVTTQHISHSYSRMQPTFSLLLKPGLYLISRGNVRHTRKSAIGREVWIGLSVHLECPNKLHQWWKHA